MADAETALQKLIAHPLRVPVYLRPVTEQLGELSDAISESLTEYLNCPVETKGCDVTREPSSEADGENADYYDTMMVAGEPALRIHLTKDDLSVLTGALFQGEVEEPMLQVKVAEAVVKRLAEAISMKALSLGADTTVVKAVDKTLSDRPTLWARYAFAIGEDKEVHPLLEVARPLSDGMSPPSDTVPEAARQQLDFLGVAILPEQKVPVATVKAWQPGDTLQLVGARRDMVTIAVDTPGGRLPVGQGELGTDGGLRCIRIGEPAEDGASTPSAFSSGMAMDPVPTTTENAGDMPFEPAPMADGFGDGGGDEEAGGGDDDITDGFAAAPMDFGEDPPGSDAEEEMPEFAKMAG